VLGEAQRRERASCLGRRHVEEERRQAIRRALWPGDRSLLSARQRVECREPDVVELGERGDQHAQRSDVAPQSERARWAPHLLHHLHQLLLHALVRQPREMRRRAIDRAERRRLDREFVATGEADGPQRAQPILAHALLGVADCSHDAAPDVLSAAERIAQLIGARAIRDRVHREVASRQVLLEARTELHHRVPAVRANVPAKSRDLVMNAVVVEHAHRAEFDPHRNGATSAEDRSHLLRGSRRREIPVEGRIAEQRIPDRPADTPRFEAGGLELLRDVEHASGGME
jgi:hypothetical protein